MPSSPKTSPRALGRRHACAALLTLPAAARLAHAAPPGQRVGLVVGRLTATLEVGDTRWFFARRKGRWAMDHVAVRGRPVARPLSFEDSFFVGGGTAAALTALNESPDAKELRFTGLGRNGAAAITYRVRKADGWPRVSVELTGVDAPTCAFRTYESSAHARGAWVTRGETGADAEGRDVFIDGSGRLVFGHSVAGAVDLAYVLQVDVRDNLHRRGRSEQRSTTFFKSQRTPAGPSAWHGQIELRMGADQPKSFAVAFDRDLGGRLHDVCERYYSAAVDSQLNLSTIKTDYDPEKAVELMPLRLSCPESFIPGYGWHMEEYFPGYSRAAYPYGEDSGIQTGAFLAYEGLATGRPWEQNFGKYVIDNMPLWGQGNDHGYFVERTGGWTRWAYYRDYINDLPLMEGGNWTTAEHLYHTARLFSDKTLKERALGLMKHDVLVKLDLKTMYFPPCWNPKTGRQDDHRDDWNITACLGYCAVIADTILYPETQDKTFLDIADKITDWLLSQWGPELRMNFLHDKVNTIHCFMGWLPRALVARYERSHDKRFLDVALDLAWIMFLTLGTTAHTDAMGRPLAGVTCVGVRGCVDYDCTPNLCHEKDLPFLEILGALLPHAGGAAYAKVLAMHKLVLPRDSWKDAFWIQEQRGLNLRTNYDNYARGTANLCFALNSGSDAQVPVYETLVARRSADVTHRRSMVLSNPTNEARLTRVAARFLRAGTYDVRIDGGAVQSHTAADLQRGIDVTVPADSTMRIDLTASVLDTVPPAPAQFDQSVTFLSDTPERAAQRGIGLPTPVFRKDRSFQGATLSHKGRTVAKGLGLAANTVIVYQLAKRHRQLVATAALATTGSVDAGATKPSANVSIFTDGRLAWDSGRLDAKAQSKDIDINLRGVDVLVLRVSSAWDDDGKHTADFVNLLDARLLGRAPG